MSCLHIQKLELHLLLLVTEDVLYVVVEEDE
jgi:predicted RNA-binding protein